MTQTNESPEFPGRFSFAETNAKYDLRNPPHVAAKALFMCRI